MSNLKSSVLLVSIGLFSITGCAHDMHDSTDFHGNNPPGNHTERSGPGTYSGPTQTPDPLSHTGTSQQNGGSSAPSGMQP